jgi:AcrR family transcriptional regulator
MATPRKPGRPVDPDLQQRRREQILDSAAIHFAESGYAGTDTQKLADELDISKGTIFHYFPTKRELFAASIERALKQLGDSVEAAAAGFEDPLEKLVGAMAAYLRFFDERPEVVELLILERVEFKDRKSSYFDRGDGDNDCDDRWRDVIAGLIDAGRFRSLDVERVRDVLGDVLYGTIFSNRMSGRARTLEEQTKSVFDIVFRGLFTDAERARGDELFHRAATLTHAEHFTTRQPEPGR